MKKTERERDREGRQWEKEREREATVMYEDLTDLNSIWQMPCRKEEGTEPGPSRCGRATLW